MTEKTPCCLHIGSDLGVGKARPSSELAEILDAQLEAGGTLAALAPEPASRRRQPTVPPVAADEIAALDLVRLDGASDVGSGTVERRELAVDEPAIAYPGTPSAKPEAFNLAPTMAPTSGAETRTRHLTW